MHKGGEVEINMLLALEDNFHFSEDEKIEAFLVVLKALEDEDFFSELVQNDLAN